MKFKFNEHVKKMETSLHQLENSFNTLPTLVFAEQFKAFVKECEKDLWVVSQHADYLRKQANGCGAGSIPLDVERVKYLQRFRIEFPRHGIAHEYYTYTYQEQFIQDMLVLIDLCATNNTSPVINERQFRCLNTLYDHAVRYEEFVKAGLGI
jgi:hypothetical protein